MNTVTVVVENPDKVSAIGVNETEPLTIVEPSPPLLEKEARIIKIICVIECFSDLFIFLDVPLSIRVGLALHLFNSHTNTPELFLAQLREYLGDFLHRRSAHSDARPYFVEMHLCACFSQRELP